MDLIVAHVYKSHRDAHAMSECSQTTSYVKITSGDHAGIGGKSRRNGTLVATARARSNAVVRVLNRVRLDLEADDARRKESPTCDMTMKRR